MTIKAGCHDGLVDGRDISPQLVVMNKLESEKVAQYRLYCRSVIIMQTKR